MSARGSARVLVTGGRGFVGARLIAALSRRHPDWEIDAPNGAPGAPDTVDVTSPEAMADWVRRGRPDMVVHLAAVSAVTQASSAPRLAWDVNLGGTLNLVLALAEHAPQARLLYVSSAEVYGATFQAGRPVDEAGLLQPVNPYAASKAAADILVRQAAAGGLSAVVMRPFNHIGPGQSEAFAVPSFAAQIARIEAGTQAPVLHVGSLDDERDFLDVDDVVEAYLLALEHEPPPAERVFNVASGQPVRMGEVLDQLLALSSRRIEVRTDPSRLRATSVRRVVGDAGRLRSVLGWNPRGSLPATLQAILAEQRALAGVRG